MNKEMANTRHLFPLVWSVTLGQEKILLLDLNLNKNDT